MTGKYQLINVILHVLLRWFGEIAIDHFDRLYMSLRLFGFSNQADLSKIALVGWLKPCHLTTKALKLLHSLVFIDSGKYIYRLFR